MARGVDLALTLERSAEGSERYGIAHNLDSALQPQQERAWREESLRRAADRARATHAVRRVHDETLARTGDAVAAAEACLQEAARRLGRAT